MKIKALLAAAFFCLAAAPALAVATIDSVDDQTFDQYQNIEQARDITITDDATTPSITASGDIRIKIPADFPVIWDDRVASVNLFGSAVDAGRFGGSSANVTYEDYDKVAVINVDEDFEAGESVTIAGLFFEGFYWSGSNAKLQLILQKGGAVVATSSKSLQVWTSTYSDNYEPEAPGNIVLQQIDSTVKITWTDPPDMDASQIQILRGVAPLPVAGTAYAEQGRGVESYTDTDLEIGDTVSYILRSSDGQNISQISDPVSITLTENTEPEPVVCTTDYTPVCGSDNVTYSNACNAEAAGITNYTDGECEVEATPPEPTEAELKAEAAGITTVQLESAVTKYSDLELSHWSAGFMARLNADEIIDGYPNGTIQPDTTINRAELAKIAANSFGLSADLTAAGFTDVPSSAWFSPFVRALQDADAVWTTSSKYYPAAGVARGEAVWTLLTAAGVEIPAVTEKSFPDVSTSHPYAAAIAWAKDNGILNGYDDGTFGINDTLTRAQVAKIVVLLKAKLAE
ncbi:MAG: S-layer homology domain-containing protein [Candidatus Peribacteraceae bacterium]|nr:S-layer homology domain-containing protein [Candidatus Peribacteraceae bacterium]